MITVEQREEFLTLLGMIEVQSRACRESLTQIKFLDEDRNKPKLVRADFMANGSQPSPEAQIQAAMIQAGNVFNGTLANSLQFSSRLSALVAKLEGKTG